MKQEEYNDVLFKEKCVRHETKRIQTKSHKLGICKINKVSLQWFDDERYILNDGDKTLPYDHKDIC